MTKEEFDKKLQELEKDITYFTNLEFYTLAEKFKRDLELVKSLMEKD